MFCSAALTKQVCAIHTWRPFFTVSEWLWTATWTLKVKSYKGKGQDRVHPLTGLLVLRAICHTPPARLTGRKCSSLSTALFVASPSPSVHMWPYALMLFPALRTLSRVSDKTICIDAKLLVPPLWTTFMFQLQVTCLKYVGRICCRPQMSLAISHPVVFLQPLELIWKPNSSVM